MTFKSELNMAEKENLEKLDKKENKAELDDQVSNDQELNLNEAEKAEENGEKEAISAEEKLSAENQELKEKYLRLYSEFENYRRRTAKERLELIKTASEDVISDLIPVLDDFERAFKAEDQEDASEQNREGKHLIYNKMLKVLASKGLKPMGELIGEEFDADQHEAITQIPAPSDALKGKIVDVLEKGYFLGEKVVRYAKVVIGK